MTAAMSAVDEAFPAAMMMVMVMMVVIGMAMSHEITPNCYKNSQDISYKLTSARADVIFCLSP
jgi:hypothetical protein